ncbi:MAG: RimK/LysX family protein [Pseudomonadota bacterium]|nr:RimK/LysX family protein [Pseudomonadota bacterium]
MPRAVLPLAGWCEYVHLPELGIGPLLAKLDTGARSAALHAENMTVYLSDNQRRIRFDVPAETGSHQVKRCDLALADARRVRNAGGRSELRHVVETRIQLGQSDWVSHITLTDRTDMGAPMLLGRSTLRDRFLIHPGRSFLLTRTQAAFHKPKTS